MEPQAIDFTTLFEPWNTGWWPDRDAAEEIAETVKAFVRPGQVAELRILKRGPDEEDGTQTTVPFSGFFNDPGALVAKALEYDRSGALAVYMTYNEVDPALLARSPNTVRPAAPGTSTSDADIRRWRCLGLDFDHVSDQRPVTDAEHNEAVAVGRRCVEGLHQLGLYAWLADSGNGVQVLVPMDEPVNGETADLVTRCMQAVATRFDTDAVKLDMSTYNPSRIWRCFGTCNRKGSVSPGRPCRRSGLLFVPWTSAPGGAVNDRAALERLAASGAAPVTGTGRQPASATPAHTKSAGQDIQQRLAAVGLKVKRAKPGRDGSTIFTLQTCPFRAHSRKDKACIIQFDDGGVIFRCLHSACSRKKWVDVLRQYPELGDLGDHPGNDHQIPDVVRLDTVQPQEVDWLWPQRVAVGKLNLWFGPVGVGKGLTFCAVAADVTMGKALPGGTPRPPAPVLICEAEDGIADTLRGRLERAGADLGKVYVVNAALQLHASGLNFLRTKLAEFRPALVVIDPLAAFVGGRVDMYRANQSRAITKELAAMAEDHTTAVVLVHHINKGEGRDALMRVAGSYDLVAAVRTAHLFGVSPSDETQRAMISVKNNLSGLSEAIGYQIDADGRFRWTGPSKLTAEEVLSAGGEAGTALKQGLEFLQRALENGPRPVGDLRDEAEAYGISLATLRRAQKALGIRPTAVYRSGNKKGVSHWTWELPSPDDPF